MTYLFQIAFIAAVGIVIGLAVGAVAPLVAMRFLEACCPSRPNSSSIPEPLALPPFLGW